MIVSKNESRLKTSSEVNLNWISREFIAQLPSLWTTASTGRLAYGEISTIPPERECVEPLPSLSPASCGLVVTVPFPQPTRLLAGSRQSTRFTMLDFN